jgi:mono/diheme cytochrome c family protein
MVTSGHAPHARARTALAILTLCIGGLIAACGVERDDPAGLAADADALALGRSVYAANCATCHGQRGEGQPNWQSRRADGTLPAPPHDASGHTWHHPDELLIEIITVGGQAAYGGPGLVSGMPAFADQLTAEEITAVLAYIKSLWGDDERTYQSFLR